MFRLATVLASVLLSIACSREAEVGAEASVEGGRTSVLLIILDTTRADHLGAWGYGPETSPRLDALASKGVRFSNFFSSAPWTRPAIASLLTGLHPRSTGIYEEQFDLLADDLVTLPERLQNEGYVTLGLTTNPNINAWFHFDQGYDEYVDSTALLPWMPGFSREKPKRDPSPQTADRTTAGALALVDRHAQRLADRPFFMQVLYIDPHLPHRGHDFGPTGPRFEGPDRGYDGEIRYMDVHVGALLDGLRERGLLEDTLVVVTSDHGEGLASHPGVPFSRTHGHHLFRSTLHVPLIFWHPSLEARPHVVATPASSIDVVPTVMALLGYDVEGPHGISMASEILGSGPAPERSHIFAETDWREANKVTVLTRRDQYIRGIDSILYQEEAAFEGRRLEDPLRAFLDLPAHQRYRLDDDRFEDPTATNLWGRRPKHDRELARALETWIRDTPARPPTRRVMWDVLTLGDGSVVRSAEHATEVEVDPAIARELEALGYLEESEP